MYMVMIYAFATPHREAYRGLFLYWAGDIVNSLLVLVPGAAVGSSSHELTFSTLLNAPYVIVPIWFAKRAFEMRRAPVRATEAPSKYVDAAFVAFFAFFVVVATLRFAIACESKWDYSVAWSTGVEPILTEPSAFFRVQSLVHFYYNMPLAIIFLLFGTSNKVVRDLAFVFAGSMAQSQFPFLWCGNHPNVEVSVHPSIAFMKEAQPM